MESTRKSCCSRAAPSGMPTAQELMAPLADLTIVMTIRKQIRRVEGTLKKIRY